MYDYFEDEFWHFYKIAHLMSQTRPRWKRLSMRLEYLTDIKLGLPEETKSFLLETVNERYLLILYELYTYTKNYGRQGNEVN